MYWLLVIFLGLFCTACTGITGNNNSVLSDVDKNLSNQEIVKFMCPQSIMWPLYSGNINIISKFNHVSNKKWIILQSEKNVHVVSFASGSVLYVGKNVGELGNLVIIVHDDKHLTSLYANLGDVYVKIDQVVKKGTKIAKLNNKLKRKNYLYNIKDANKLYFQLKYLDNPVNPLECLQ